MLRKKMRTGVLALLMFPMSSTIAAMAGSDEERIKKSLAQMVPNVEQAQITKMPVKSLYQVIIDGQLVYMSADGRYLVSGKILDLKNRVNLTDQAKQGLVQKALAKLEPETMIIYPAKGLKKHTITVFSDIDCPYCEKLHHEVPALNQAGIEVRYLAYPRAGLNSPSYDKAVSVWCAKDKNRAMNLAMGREAVPQKTCSNPVKQDMQVAKQFGVTGTPTIVFDSGEVLPGYVPASRLIKALNAQ